MQSNTKPKALSDELGENQTLIDLFVEGSFLLVNVIFCPTLNATEMEWAVTRLAAPYGITSFYRRNTNQATAGH